MMRKKSHAFHLEKAGRYTTPEDIKFFHRKTKLTNMLAITVTWMSPNSYLVYYNKITSGASGVSRHRSSRSSNSCWKPAIRKVVMSPQWKGI